MPLRAVVLELDLPDGIVNPRRRDCSMCRRNGAIVASVPLAGITIIQGSDALRQYDFILSHAMVAVAVGLGMGPKVISRRLLIAG